MGESRLLVATGVEVFGDAEAEPAIAKLSRTEKLKNRSSVLKGRPEPVGETEYGCREQSAIRCTGGGTN
jgi:hypothetical protein